MNFKDNKIILLDKQVNKSEPSLIPKPPFSLQITGSKGGGKSTTLLNLLLNKNLLGGKFNRICWISPTSKLDSKLNILQETPGIITPNNLLLRKLQEKKQMKVIADFEEKGHEYHTSMNDSDFYDEVNADLLKEIMEEQRMIIETYGKKYSDKVLLIYDDSASEKKFWSSKQTLKMIYNSRHYNISIIYSTQNYFSIPKPIRLNNSSLILFETANRKEIQMIYEENNGKLSFKDFYKMYQSVVSEPFSFLTINYQNPNEYRFIKNFESFI